MSLHKVLMTAALVAGVLVSGLQTPVMAASKADARKASLSASRLTTEIKQHYGAKTVAKFNRIKNRGQMIRFLSGLKKSGTAQALVKNAKLAGPSPRGGGGATHIDPIDLGCLNCLGVHCPTKSDSLTSN